MKQQQQKLIRCFVCVCVCVRAWVCVRVFLCVWVFGGRVVRVCKQKITCVLGTRRTLDSYLNFPLSGL